MAYTPIYTPKNFSDWGPPDLDASNLNDIEAALVSLGNGLQTAAADTDTNTAAITTINGEISDLNNLIDEILPDDSESGNPAVITDAFGGACKSLKLTLEPIQSGSGTPSPQNVRTISGRTQANVNATGRNLYIGSPSFDGYSNLSNWTLQTETYNGHEVYKNVGGWNGLNKTIFLKAGTYTFSCMVKGSQANTPLYIFNASNTILLSTTVGTSWQKVSAVLNQGTDSNVTLRVETSGATPSLYVSEYMLEMGSEATPYQEWGESVTIQLGQTVYGGVLDVTSGVLTITHTLIDLGDLTWGKSSSGNRFYTNLSTPYKWADNLVMYCSAYNFDGVGNSNRGYYGADKTFRYYWLGSGSPSYELYVANEDYSSAEAFAISVVGYKLCYELATPTTVQLTPEEVTLLKGDNVITTDADNVDVEYKADITLYIAKQLGGNLGNRGAKSAPAEEPADDSKEEEKTDDEIIEPVTKEAKK